jgi:hypothetical protein
MGQTKNKKRKRGKTPNQLMQEHILNKNDIITQEEFENMDIGTAVPGNKPALEIKPGKQRPKDEDKDHSISTPWDVID